MPSDWPGGATSRAGLCATIVCMGLATLIVSCAPRPLTPALTPVMAPAHPEFQYPAVPSSLRNPAATASLERGWQDLQRDKAPAARREFASALQRDPAFYPALAGQGYAGLAEQQYEQALGDFDRALSHARDYVPALVGRGQALLALNRLDEAIDVFAAAAQQDPSIEGLRERVEVLRFRSLQDRMTQARTAAAAGRTADARQAYQAAIAASPESGFLYRELAGVEASAGEGAAAQRDLRRAIELDPTDVSALLELGRLLERQPDVAGALQVYRDAAALQPTQELSATIATLTRRLRDDQLPQEFRTLSTRTQVTRGDLAALIGVRLDTLVAARPSRPVVVTDARGHWASPWIGQVVDAGLMNALDNHTFQPAAGLRRADLAEVAARLVSTIPAPTGAAGLQAARPPIADVPPSHLGFAAIALVVNAGVMPLLDGQRFQVTRVVTGAEAVEVIDRIGVLAAAGR